MSQCVLSCSFNNPVTLASTRLRIPEDDADASNHVGILMIYKIFYIYVCAFVALDNKLKMHSMYIKDSL